MTLEVLILLIVFQVKHLIADYYLQAPYMYENKGKKEGWAGPLFEHALVHATLTFAIMIYYGWAVAICAFLIDLITHFWIDRWKAVCPSTPAQTKFWHKLGIDQFLHHMVGILIIFLALV